MQKTKKRKSINVNEKKEKIQNNYLIEKPLKSEKA